LGSVGRTDSRGFIIGELVLADVEDFRANHRPGRRGVCGGRRHRSLRGLLDTGDLLQIDEPVIEKHRDDEGTESPQNKHGQN
jgi:hypothetical protein